MIRNRTAIFFANGFEDCEGMIPLDMFRRARVPIDSISMNDDLTVHTSHGVALQADGLFSSFDPQAYDILILPGGKRGTAVLDGNESLKEYVRSHIEQGKLLGAICAAPSILGKMGLLKGKNYTCFPEFDGDYGGSYQMELAVTDGNIVTGRGMGASVEFARQLLMQIVDEAAMKKLEYGMQYEHAFRTLRKPE